jgi:hypothetical protein
VRCSFCFLLIAAGAFAQEPAPKGIVRGKLVTVAAGNLSLVTPLGSSYRCSFDHHTYMEREGQRIFAPALRADDPVEVITDLKAGDCYARTIRIVSATSRLLGARSYRPALDHIFPRGNLTFAGVVRRFNGNVLVLRTREDAEKIVLLREDTRYLEGGHPTDFTKLAVNTRVFVRGGRNVENDLEAYQVIWGEIPGPKR